MRREFQFWGCDRCGVEHEARAFPPDWFKVDFFARQFQSMKERHFCPTCGPIVEAAISERTGGGEG